MKEVKKFLSDYEEDFNPNVSLDKIKSQITFENNSKIKEKRRVFDLKLVLTVFVTILIVIPATILITRIYSPAYSDDPNRNIYLYLDKNFDNYLSSPIESELLDNEAIISFYLGIKSNEFYVITFLETKNDYIPHFKTTPNQLITNINSSISTIKVDDINLLTIEVTIEYNDKTINSSYLLELDNFKHLIQ